MSVQATSNNGSAANRLTIGFLLTWTLCTAISLAIDRWDFLVHADVLPEELTYWTAYAFAFRPLNGVCLAFMLVVAKRLLLGQSRLPTDAGHWFLLAMAVRILTARTEDVLLLSGTAEATTWLREGDELLRSILRYGPAIATALCGAIFMRQNAWWRLMLVSMCLNWILIVAHAWHPVLVESLAPPGIRLDVFEVAFLMVVAALSLAAMIRDRQTGRRQDFYHWLGVATMWATVLLCWPFHFWYVAIYG